MTICSRPADLRLRLLCTGLALLILISSCSALDGLASEAERYGKINIDKVVFRVKISASDLWSRLDKGWVCKILEEQTVDGVLWYKVTSNTPDHLNRSYTGFIRGDLLTEMTAEETAAWLANPVQMIPGQTPAAQPASTAMPVPFEKSLFAVTTQGGINLRSKPEGGSLTALPAGTIVSILEKPEKISSDSWYKVTYQQYTGYIASKFLREISAAEAGTLPTPAAGNPGQVIGYIKIKLQGTNLRATPGGLSQLQLDKGTVMGYFSAPVYALGYYWIYTSDPDSSIYGYVRSDCYQFTDESGVPVVTNSPTAPVSMLTPTPLAGMGFIKLIKGAVNLRDKAAGETIGVLDRGEVMPYFDVISKSGYSWYKVFSSKGAGYIRSDMIIVTDAEGVPATVVPTSGVTQTPAVASGYIITIKSNVYLRKFAQVGSSILDTIVPDSILPLAGNTVQNNGYTWYFAVVNGQTGYVRGDCARRLSSDEVEAYLAGRPLPTATPVPTATPAPSKYIITVLDKVNLRVSASKDSRVVKNVPLGTVLNFTSTTISGGQSWYKIIYGTSSCYVLASCVRVMNTAEYTAYLGTLPTASPTPTPTPTPRPEDMSNIALTNTTNVLVRKSASLTASMITKLYKTGEICTLTGDTQTADGFTWYKLKVKGVTGWIKGDLLRVLTKVEAMKLQAAGNPDAPNEASYRTLSKGSAGDDVRRLQDKLQELGYLGTVDVTGTYLTSTTEAVKRFQRDMKLIIDGIAGANTQHKLFGTVPVGTYSGIQGSTVTPALNPCELIDWYTGGIQSIWAMGTTAVITDVKTGISFKARRWAGGAHADAEPLTAADTAAMCRIYGVSTSQAIADNNLYQRRPLWVTVGGRTFAASLYGVPHNYPEGDTIADNEYSGQFCVHFVNSRTHGSSTVDPDHQAAIRYAYDHAPSRK